MKWTFLLVSDGLSVSYFTSEETRYNYDNILARSILGSIL